MYEIEMFTILTFNWKVPCRLNWLENRWEWIQTWLYSSLWILDMLGDPIYQITWRSCSEVWPWPSPTDSSLLKSCCTLKVSEWLKNWPRRLFHSSSKDWTEIQQFYMYIPFVNLIWNSWYLNSDMNYRKKINSWSSVKVSFIFNALEIHVRYYMKLIVRNFSCEFLMKHNSCDMTLCIVD